jgi:hypothetical protein
MQWCCKCGVVLWILLCQITKRGQFKDSKWSRHKILTFWGPSTFWPLKWHERYSHKTSNVSVAERSVRRGKKISLLSSYLAPHSPLIIPSLPLRLSSLCVTEKACQRKLTYDLKQKAWASYSIFLYNNTVISNNSMYWFHTFLTKCQKWSAELRQMWNC